MRNENTFPLRGKVSAAPATDGRGGAAMAAREWEAAARLPLISRLRRQLPRSGSLSYKETPHAEHQINYPAQAAAISARGGSLLVSAAAGSGKTRVLVERVVGLITDPVHPVDANQLLIMTFTNAAAAKLRADITTRLAQEVRAHPGDLHLRSQQLLLQRASIGTVDAFCLHFVQQHFAMLDVPPDFETADEADLARIEQETLAATLETAYQDPDFRAFADLYDRGRTDNTAGDAILDLYHFTRALPHPAASLAAFAAMWQQDAPPKDTLWGKELLGIALARAQGAKTLLESGAAIAARDEAADRAYTAVMQDDAARVKNLCYYLKEGDWDKSLAALDAVLTGCTADVAELEAMEMSEDQVRVTDNGDNSLTVTNLTQEPIVCVRVFYKYYMEDLDVYVGGIAYTAKVTDLQPGEEVQIIPSHYAAGSSRIVMVRTYDTE